MALFHPSTKRDISPVAKCRIHHSRVACSILHALFIPQYRAKQGLSYQGDFNRLPRLLVVQPRLHPQALFRAKLFEAIRLADSLEELRGDVGGAAKKELPPYVLVQNPEQRRSRKQGKRVRSDAYFGAGTIQNVCARVTATDSQVVTTRVGGNMMHLENRALHNKLDKQDSIKGFVKRQQVQGQLADKVLELFENMKGRVFNPRQDACQEVIKSISRKLEAHSNINKAREVLELFDRIDTTPASSQSTLRTICHCLGRFGNHTACRDYLLGLNSKGNLTDAAMELMITSYVEGLTKNFRGSSQLQKDVEGLKMICASLNLWSSASFNLLIAHCGTHGEIDLCIDLIKAMKESGVELSASTYEPLIIFYARTLEIAKAEDVLKAMRRTGMVGTIKSYRYLVYAYAMSHNLEKAYNVIMDISTLGITNTAEVYTPIIYAYGSKGQYRQALHVLKQMKKSRVNPIAENFAILINACASRKDSQQAIEVFQLFSETKDWPLGDFRKVIAAMLRVYANCGELKHAQEIMSNKEISSLVNNVEAKSALLSGLAKSGEVQEAVKVFNDIRNMGGWPVSTTFLTLLVSVGTAGDFDQLLSLFETFKKSIKGKNRVQRDEQISSACVIVAHSFIRHNQLEWAVEFLQQVQRENIGDVETLCLTVFQSNIKDQVLEETSMPLSLDDKFKFLESMHKKLGLQPTRIAFEGLLESCAREKDVHRAQYVVKMMKQNNLHLNIFTYLILFRTVVSAGNQNDAKETTKEMKRAMENYGLHDAHVKNIILQILMDSRNSGTKSNSRQWREELFHMLYSSRT